MTVIDNIKLKVRELYEKNPNIHITISMTHPKINLQNEPVVLKGVYPHIFQIEERTSGFVRCHSLQYSDILTKQIEILELNEK